MPLKARIDRALKPKVKKERPGDSEEHLKFVRTLPCCVCHLGKAGPGGQAHHLLRAVDGAPKGVGRKHLDRYTIPLCPQHHLATYGKDSAHGHGNDEEWLAGHGIQGIDLANTLWSITQNKPREEWERLGIRAVARCKR